MHQVVARFRNGRPHFLSVLCVVVVVGCSRSPQEREAQALSKGKSYMSTHDYSRAVLEFKNAVSAVPKDADAYYQLALAELQANRTAEAVSALRSATQLNPNHSAAQLKLAELMIMARTPELAEQAEQRLQSVLNVHPNDKDALYALAAVTAERGHSGDAEGYLRKIIALDPQFLNASVSLASLRKAAKDSAEAEAILLKSVENNRKSPSAQTVLALFYESARKPAKAEKALNAALRLEPANAVALSELARLLEDSGRQAEAAQTYHKISQLADRQFRPAYGIFLLQRGDLAGAIAEFQSILKENPDDRASRSRLITAYLLSNRSSDAEAVLDSALKQNSKDVPALVERGKLLLAARKVSEAEECARRALTYEPSYVEAHVLLAAIHQVNGSLSQQRQELSEALRLQPNLQQVRLNLAAALISAKDPAGAIELLKQAPDNQKSDPAVMIMRIWALINSGDLPEARKLVEAGLRPGNSALSAPLRAEMLLQDGLLKLAAKNYPAAKSSFSESLRLSPEDIRSLKGLVAVYAVQKQTESAIAAVRDHAAKHPNSSETESLLASLFLARGDQRQARIAFQAAKAAGDVSANLQLARLDMLENKPAEARAEVAEILKADPQNSQANFVLGLIEDAAGNLKAAEVQFRTVVAADPSNAQALNNLAYDLIRTGDDTRDALAFAQKAKGLLPDSPTVQDTLGWAYYANGMYQEARRELESAVERDKRPSIRYHLGLVYRKLGDKEQGDKLTMSALAEDPSLVSEFVSK